MLSSPKTELDLGTVPISKPKKFSFIVNNNADYPISPGLRTGCTSCTTAHLVASTIVPHGTTTIEATFTPTTYGQQTKSIQLSYLPKNSNRTQVLTFRFKAIVV